jgi:nicotinate-nucleotide pyrophosphorylase
VITKAAIVRGPANKILVGERTGLNMLARASGIGSFGFCFRVVLGGPSLMP